MKLQIQNLLFFYKCKFNLYLKINIYIKFKINLNIKLYPNFNFIHLHFVTTS